MTVNFRNYIGWDLIVEQFFKSAGLEQTLKGFRNDMIVMSHDWEIEEVYPALHKMESNFKELSQNEKAPQTNEGNEGLKLEWIPFANTAIPSTPSQLNRTISQFIAQNRFKNNLSNRNEFLRKRRRVTVTDESGSTTEIDAPTCARTDSLPISRDVQIKYDIAKNEHGPLARTLNPGQNHTQNHSQLSDPAAVGTDNAMPDLDQKHSSNLERFYNLEDHLAVRYVPSPPVSLLDRIQFLEDHIIRLEKNYPPWAALHFKQPNRGWPPPPRATPLIIPTHLTAASNLAPDLSPSGVAIASQGCSTMTLSRSSGSLKLSKKKSSSLHRAVLEKLEVKRALAGED